MATGSAFARAAIAKAEALSGRSVNKQGIGAMTTRTHFTFRIDTWTPDGESIVEHIAGVEDYQVALARTLAGHPHHPAPGCARDRRQSADANRLV
jgi:hypothetical protein